jgi:hypothetical protein
MSTPTLAPLKFRQFSRQPATDLDEAIPVYLKEPAADLDENLPAFLKEPVTDFHETVYPDSSANLPAVILPRQRTIAGFLPRMRTIANVSNITGVALIAGLLMQVYYSGSAPTDAWSAPALSSFMAVMLFNFVLLFLKLT